MQLLGTAYRRLGRVDEAAFALSVGVGGRAGVGRPVDRRDDGVPPRLRRAPEGCDAVLPRGPDPRQSRSWRRCSARSPTISRCSITSAKCTSRPSGRRGRRPLEQVVARDPARFGAYVNLASGYLQQNDLVRARAADRPRDRDQPVVGSRPRNQGAHSLARGDDAARRDTFRDAVRYDPRNVRAMVWQGMVEMNLHESRATRSRASRVPRAWTHTRRCVGGRRQCRDALGAVDGRHGPAACDAAQSRRAGREDRRPSVCRACAGEPAGRVLSCRVCASGGLVLARAPRRPCRQRGPRVRRGSRTSPSVPAFDFVHRSGHRDKFFLPGDHGRRRRAVRHGQRRLPRSVFRPERQSPRARGQAGQATVCTATAAMARSRT